MNNSKIYLNAELVSRANSMSSLQREKLFYLCLKETVVGLPKNSHEITGLVDEFRIPLYAVLDLLGLFIGICDAFMQTKRSYFEEMLKDAGFSRTFIKNIPFQGTQPVSLLLNPSNGIQNLSSFTWRVDISFSCGYEGIQRMPSILLAIGITNGPKYIIQLNYKQFTRLRFFISYIIKEFGMVKKQTLLKNNPKVLIE